MSGLPGSDSRALVEKLWHYCNVLRDDGLSYGDYVEQLTYLLFLKMTHERTEPPFYEPARLPAEHSWPSLTSRRGTELQAHYGRILAALGREPGLLGLMFGEAQNRVRDPRKLERLIIDLIDRERWLKIDSDVKGDVYEGLLEKNATDTKSGAGQYFTPRPLIHAMVDVMQPRPGETIADPAAGTGGFIVAAHEYISRRYALDPRQRAFLRDRTFRGTELVGATARLCAMNLFLHGIGGTDLDAAPPIEVGDALVRMHSPVDLVLANPPFGRRSSLAGGDRRLTPDAQPMRSDLCVATTNKQLNFLQHIVSMLKDGGRAAVVMPDNVLFEAGAAESIRRRLLHDCDVHTMLRLPTGIFYAQSVKASVLFFTRRLSSDSPATRILWVYDLRTSHHFTLKTRPLRRSNLDEFVDAYRAGHATSSRVESERFMPWSYAELTQRPHLNLDVWARVRDPLRLDPFELEAPEVLAQEIIDAATVGIEAFKAIAQQLERLAAPAADATEEPRLN